MKLKALVVMLVAVSAAVTPAGANSDSRTPPFDAGEVCYRTLAGLRCATQSALDPAAPLASQARDGKLATGVLWWAPDGLTVEYSAAIVRYTAPTNGTLHVSGRGLIVGREFCFSLRWVISEVTYEHFNCFPSQSIGSAAINVPVAAGRHYEARFSVRSDGDFIPRGAKISHIDLTFTR